MSNAPSDLFAVRPVRAEDRPAWEALYRGYVNVWPEPVTRKRLDQVWDFLMNPAHATRGFVVANGNDLAGSAHILVYPCTRTGQQIAYLQDLYVAPAWRKRGFGESLIRHIVALGHREGWRYVHWKTDANNATAQRLYDKIATRDDKVHYKIACTPPPAADS